MIGDKRSRTTECEFELHHPIVVVVRDALRYDGLLE